MKIVTPASRPACEELSIAAGRLDGVAGPMTVDDEVKAEEADAEPRRSG